MMVMKVRGEEEVKRTWKQSKGVEGGKAKRKEREEMRRRRRGDEQKEGGT